MCNTSTHILFPPQFEPFQPYLSGPYLKALLARMGVAASFFDANIDFYEWVLKQAHHQSSWPTRPTRSDSYLRENVDRAVRILQSEPRSLHDYRWAVNVTDEYLHSVSPADVKLGLTYLKIRNRYSSSELQTYVATPDNIFRQYFDYALEDILGGPDVSTYLLSLVVIDQVPAAVAFSREIKKRRPFARIVIGGPIVSRLHRQLSSAPGIAQAFDAIVPGEAYRVLPEALGLPHLFTGHITPDFSDIDWSRYWSCRRVLPYLVAHGCKWGKCTFCSHHLTYDGYRESGIQEVLSDLELLVSEHQIQHISFCDEYLTPAQLEELATGLIERNIDVRWSTFVRPEPAFMDHELMKQLQKAGCRMLMFGLESGSQRVLNAMKKGTKVASFRPILEGCKDANIAVRYDFMVGFPGETEAEANETYSFIKRNRDVIDTPFSSYSVAAFELRSGIPVLDETERFHLVPKDRLRGDLDDQYEFESAEGMNAHARADWRARLIRLFKLEMDAELICPQNKTHQLVLKDLHTSGLLDLPTVQIHAEMFGQMIAKLAEGVEVIYEKANLRVLNHANGGELETSRELVGVFRSLQEGASLATVFEAQSLWNLETFVHLVSFLSRNDYVIIETANMPLPVEFNERHVPAAVSGA